MNNRLLFINYTTKYVYVPLAVNLQNTIINNLIILMEIEINK